MGTCNYVLQKDFNLYIMQERGDETYEELEALKNKEIDYISLRSDL